MRRCILFRQFILITLFLLAARHTMFCEAIPVNQNSSDVCNSTACEDTAQFLLDSMDTTVDPCDDFFRYACGGWIDKHPIPEEKSHYTAFSVLDDEVKKKIQDLLKTNANYIKPIRDATALFQGCMDEEAREIQGLDPLKNVLMSLGGWPLMNPDWSGENYRWHTQVANAFRTVGVRVIVSLYVSADSKESSQNIITVTQALFGLGRKELLNPAASKHNTEITDAYRRYIISVVKLLNPDVDHAQLFSDVDEIIQFESSLATLSRPQEEKDPVSRYNKMTISEMDIITANEYFKWVDFLNTIFEDISQLTDETQIIVAEVDYIKNAIKLIQETNPRTVANYIGWIVAKRLGGYTTKDFKDIAFQFRAVLTGVKKQSTLEKSCTSLTTGNLGFAVGRLYVDNYFAEEEKRDVDELVEDIRIAYEVSLNHNTWMDPETKNKAIDKLRSMINKMGYPPWIKNDTELIDYYDYIPNLKKEEFFESLMKVREAMIAMGLEEWNETIDRETEWNAAPATVNAYFSSTANSIIFPAGILNPPFYKYGRSAVLNYGAIGSVIGHEISHGFDDEGSQYDNEGNLVNWWSNETLDEFNEKADCFRKQYSSYVEPATNMTVNGNNTVGDNIADNGGVRNAFLAYKMRLLQSDGKAKEQDRKLPGLSATPEQLFFLAYANVWCGNYRTKSMKYKIQYGSHSPPEFRVKIPLSNSRAFAEAFSCPLGSPMNPGSKCELW